ncbi:hypothetical protein [Motilimonas sp. E26]|uniref:hypothetical protein n=1 Tax=Motilimonas sp. E26 TaxID=2865674 RepID=UPI001E51EBA4|nr:hypothetical protein [Motilimonas sp. E26]MCE0555521.1 hypothetical protein [Motilimonas sp. E26]
MESEKQAFSGLDPNEMFESIDLNSFDEAFSDFSNSLNSFYHRYSSDTPPRQMRHFDSFDAESLDESDRLFVEKALASANFNEHSLRDEW